MSNDRVFIIKKNTSSNKTIRMQDDLILRLQNIASEKDISFNKLIVQCCEFALRYLPEEQSTEE